MRKEALLFQRKRIERYAIQKHFQIVTFYEDNGVPGNQLNRPGLSCLLKDYERGLFDTVMVTNKDRLARGQKSWPFKVISIQEKLRQKGEDR